MNIGLEQAIQELKALPTGRRMVATQYIHGLFTQSRAERMENLSKAFAVDLSAEDAEAWLNSAHECRQLEGNTDVETW